MNSGTASATKFPKMPFSTLSAASPVSRPETARSNSLDAIIPSPSGAPVMAITTRITIMIAKA